MARNVETAELTTDIAGLYRLVRRLCMFHADGTDTSAMVARANELIRMLEELQVKLISTPRP